MRKFYIYKFFDKIFFKMYIAKRRDPMAMFIIIRKEELRPRRNRQDNPVVQFLLVGLKFFYIWDLAKLFFRPLRRIISWVRNRIRQRSKNNLHLLS